MKRSDNKQAQPLREVYAHLIVIRAEMSRWLQMTPDIYKSLLDGEKMPSDKKILELAEYLQERMKNTSDALYKIETELRREEEWKSDKYKIKKRERK